MRMLAVAALWAIAGIAVAQEPAGVPVTDDVVRDAEFGVTARHFGLERRVAMYQWAKSAGQASGQGYVQAWSEHAIDSRGFAPGHDNPALPLHSRRWVAAINLDGKPLDASVIERLGVWRMFRPNFSALPGNLAATFQPEGDGLGSAENPLDPQIGDLRIHWRELTLPSLQGRIVLRDGRWQLSPDATPETPPATQPKKSRAPWWFGGGALVVLMGLAIARRRRR
ncbi:TMEM43 family protein [Lysobacter sp. CFH 32150]|uniref:TMEM43 family protein n=1 Tax=Lysobacter sp. CFH 32150 TaxID=2927128 RepID=UPI001FA7798B|nr:TMEM43 family protein [Lysobacter sp. CFH 32150]MCI4566914.1 TMEM43 family protein [Lysobacter sp. CFH 32150]